MSRISKADVAYAIVRKFFGERNDDVAKSLGISDGDLSSRITRFKNDYGNIVEDLCVNHIFQRAILEVDDGEKQV